MKKYILTIISLIVVLSLKAQSNVDEIAFIQSVYGMDKKDLIAKHMKIDVGKSELFWQLYDEYEISRKEIGLKRANNIIAYANKYEKLIAADADALVKTSFEVQTGFIKLWEKTYIKMSKVLSPVTAAQFIQAEMFLENMVRQELSMDIPLIGEFELDR